VTFHDGAGPLATVALNGAGTAILKTTFAIGDHPITATYNGDTSFAASTTSSTHAGTRLGHAGHGADAHDFRDCLDSGNGGNAHLP
jgi:hypothetical protein